MAQWHESNHQTCTNEGIIAEPQRKKPDSKTTHISAFLLAIICRGEGLNRMANAEQMVGYPDERGVGQI
jgi:hypothetical protein